MEILQMMKQWNWNTFESELNKLGYSIKAAKRHANGMPYDYAITIGKLYYKSSEIGEGRHFMTSKIENTWKKLHPAPKEERLFFLSLILVISLIQYQFLQQHLSSSVERYICLTQYCSRDRSQFSQIVHGDSHSLRTIV